MHALLPWVGCLIRAPEFLLASSYFAASANLAQRPVLEAFLG